VVHEVPSKSINPLGYLMLGLRAATTSAMNSIARPVPDPPDSGAAFGEYVANLASCTVCHGPDLHGGHRGQLPPLGPNLTRLVHDRPFTTFELALRHGARPAGGALDPVLMPWPIYARLTDLEARAVYEYIRSLPG
jgi:cytochrome c553